MAPARFVNRPVRARPRSLEVRDFAVDQPEAYSTQIESAYWRLREDILRGALQPEAKLRIEQLRQSYGLGASPLREALSRLVSDGLVETEGQRGYWVAPTVIRNVAADSELARRELFGPVLAEFTATDLDHAIALANDTQYGLSASLFTRDLRSALRYIDRIHVGLVRVNGDTTGVDPHAPFGGMKGSSSGSREQGPAAREFYTEIKTVQVNP